MAPPSDERQPLIHSQYISQKSTNPFHDQEIEPVNAQPNNKHVVRPHVFGSQSQYVSRDSFDLMIYKESGAYRVMKDIYEGTLFTVKLFTKYSPNPLLVLLDPNETPVALLENVTSHDRWDVSAIRESILDSEKVFSASGNHTAVNVSLEDQRSRFDHVDFQVKWLDKTCTIYMGDSSTVIAKMHPAENGRKLSVKIYHNMNYAFVVTIFVIIDAMKFTEPVNAQPSYKHVLRPHVFGSQSQYVSRDSFDLMIYKESGVYRVMKDIYEGTMFTVKLFTKYSPNPLLVLLDPNETPVALLENVTSHDRWDVSAIRESILDLEKVFSASRNHTAVNVSLEDERSRFDHVDFKVKWLDKTCIIYKGDSSTVIAKMRRPENGHKLSVKVYPNMNYAFVVTIFVIIDAMKFTEYVAFPSVMDQPSGESVCAPLIMPQPVSCSHVIGLKYSSEGLTELLFEKTENSAAGEYSVSKAESRGERMFTIKSHNTTFHSQLKLLDEDGKRIAMLRKKNATGHSRWVVLCVDGENEASLKKVFSVCKSHMIQRQMDLNVILGKGRSAADFKVTGSWTDKTCTISKGQGDSSTKVAQMRPLVNDEGKFKVDVYSNVDCAFVVTLIAIVDAMKSFSNLKVAAGRAADFAVKLAVGAACAAVADCV